MKPKINIRDQRNGNWYWISRIIYQEYSSKIGAIGLALYNAYASYSFGEQEVYPSQATISKSLHITIPTLIEYDKRLVKHKLIHIQKQEGKVNIVTLLKVRPLKELNRTTKRALEAPLKELNTNKKKRRRKNKWDKSHESLLPSSTDLTSFDSRQAKKLSSIVSKKNKMSRKVGEKRWSKEIRLLRTSQNIKKMRIRKVIQWLGHYIDEEYTPKIYKAVDFREKFLRIEDAMERVTKKIEKGEQPTKYNIEYE